MTREKKIVRNLLSEILPQVLVIVLGLLKSKFYLDYLGSNTVGLTQIFAQIMGYLSLVEGGLGQAVIYRLYKPINEKDYKKISKIRNGTKNIFYKIIIIILVLSIFGGLLIPFLIKNNPYTSIFILFNFMLYVISEIILYTTVFERSLYVASEKSYKLNLVIKSSLIVKYVFEIVLAMTFKSVTIIFISLIVISIIENFFVRVITNKDFKNIKESNEKDISVLKDVKNLIVHKIAGLVATNIDIILISSFLGLSKVLIYSTYLLYFNAIVALTNKISRAMVGTVGNLIIENKSRSLQFFKEFNGMVFLMALLISGPFGFLINYFITIFYSGKVVVSLTTNLLFTLVLAYNIIRIPLITYTEGGGLFKETKICPIIESVVNLSLSFILIKRFGINGCLLGTLISLIVSEYIMKPTIVFKKLFDRSAIEYYKMNIPFLLILFFQLFISVFLQKYIIINSLTIFAFYALIYFILNSFIILNLFKILGQDSILKKIKRMNLRKIGSKV